MSDGNPEIKCPECGRIAEVDENSFQCHFCQKLWPLSYAPFAVPPKP